MTNSDTISLLHECNSGTRMAVYSIDEVMENVKEEKLRNLLFDSRQHHEQLGNELHDMLQRCGDEPKEPGAIVKGMSWMKTNAKLMMEDSDRVCADLITDGCNMGVKTLYRYLNEYAAADENAKDKTRELIRMEKHLADEMTAYL